MLDDLDQFSTLISQLNYNKFDMEESIKWRNKYVGPLPASHMPKRVVNQILKLIDSKLIK